MTAPNASRILSKGLRLLEALAEHPDGIRPPGIASELGLHRSSVYRYLNPLVEMGFAEKRGDGSYELGRRVLELATLHLERIDLRSIARATLIRLCEETSATVHLCQLDGPEVVYLDKVETARTLPLYSRIGGRAPAFCTGVGKALLAFLHPERQAQVLEQVEFRPYTKNTIRSASDLRKELARIRERGYAVDRGEHEEGVYCVAAPIFDYSGEPVGSISATDLGRKVARDEPRYRDPVLRASASISRRLGFRGKGVDPQ